MNMEHIDDITMIINAMRECRKLGKRIIDSNIDIKIAQHEDKEKVKSNNNILNNICDATDIKIEYKNIKMEPYVDFGYNNFNFNQDKSATRTEIIEGQTTTVLKDEYIFELEDIKFDQSESISKDFNIESKIEKYETINTYIDDFIAELENTCISNNNDNDMFQPSSITLDEIDEFLNSLSIDENPKVVGVSQVEWDDDIIFDHDNIVPQDETSIAIVDHPNSYDIVPMGDNTIVTMPAKEAASVDKNQTDSERELTCAKIVEVQKLAFGIIKDCEKNIFTVCADEQAPAVLEAVCEESFKDTGDAIRRVWDPGVNLSDGVNCLSI